MLQFESFFLLTSISRQVYNELGVCLMLRSQQQFNDTPTNHVGEVKEQVYQQTAKKSYDYLMKSVALFEGAQDSINLIICNLNLGRFFRFAAHADIFHEIQVANSMESQKKMYNESFNSYHRALTILGNRKANPELWDMVNWELSTSTFNLAKNMQDNSESNGSTDELEREVLEMLMKALKYCDLETNSARQVLYSFRAGLIHHRLGSFYHHSLRNIVDDNKKRTTLQLCRLNYEKSANLLESLKEFKDYFQVQMERIALQEYLGDDSQAFQQKFKSYQFALQHFCESSNMLKLLSDAKSINEIEELETLMELFEKRLQHVLKTLTKLSMSGKKIDSKVEVYKKMFACTLRPGQKIELKQLVIHLVNVLCNIQKCDSI